MQFHYTKEVFLRFTNKSKRSTYGSKKKLKFYKLNLILYPMGSSSIPAMVQDTNGIKVTVTQKSTFPRQINT